MTGVHGAQVEELDDGTGLLQLGGVVRRGGKLLEDLAPHTGRRLLLLDDGAVAKVAFDKELRLFVADENIAAADVVEPPLHQRFYARLILLGSGAGRGERRRYGRDKGIGVRRYQVFGKLDKLGVKATNVAILGSPIPGEIRLVLVSKMTCKAEGGCLLGENAYMYVKSQDGVLSPCPFQPSDFGLQLVLRLRSPGLLLLLVLLVLRWLLLLSLLPVVLSLLPVVLSLMLRMVVWSVSVFLRRCRRQPLLSGPEALMGFLWLLLCDEPPSVRLLDGLGG